MALGFGSRLRFVLVLLALPACQPKLVVGAFSCTGGADAAVPAQTAPVEAPWSTSFEAATCDYTLAAGFCYADAEAGFEAVTSPVHSGRYALAFHVGGSDGGDDQQARCVRQGVLPQAAYYGAWYFIPTLAINDGKVWNLFHFQGGDTTSQKGLWDVSLVNDDAQDDLEVVVYQFGGSTYRTQTPIPIGQWFHLELYLARANDMTGEVALFQDGVQLIDQTNLSTDNGSAFEQWYVGNYSTGLIPADSTVFVDDVTISETH